MKYFVTGAPGFIGSRVVDQLLAEGHQVTGLARSEERAEGLKAKGATPVIADLREVDVIARAAAEADGVVHLAYIHDFDKLNESLPVELAVVQGMLDAMKGTNKPFIGSNGTGGMPETDTPADETVPIDRNDPLLVRQQAEELIVKGAQSGIRTAALRLAPYVYDENGAAFSQIQERKAQELGVASYIGDGSNPSPCTYVEDAAAAYVLALKHAKPGAVYNVTNGSVTNKQINEGIAAKHGLKVRSVSKEEAVKLYGPFLTHIFGKRNLPDSTKAKTELHWQPKRDRSYFLQALAGKA